MNRMDFELQNALNVGNHLVSPDQLQTFDIIYYQPIITPLFRPIVHPLTITNPSEHMKISWGYESQLNRQTMFQTTNQSYGDPDSLWHKS